MIALEKVDPSWGPILYKIKEEPLSTLFNKVLPNISYQPKVDNIFSALQMPVSSIKVVILGSGPYSSPMKSVGHAFLLSKYQKKSNTLLRIEEEILKSDPLNVNDSKEVDMYSWIDQGVLLLDTALTVETCEPGSHRVYWRDFIQHLISFISYQKPCMWLFWGNYVREFLPYVGSHRIEMNQYDMETINEVPLNTTWNYIFTSDYPLMEPYEKSSFYNNNHFYFVNKMLAWQGKKTIIW